LEKLLVFWIEASSTITAILSGRKFTLYKCSHNVYVVNDSYEKALAKDLLLARGSFAQRKLVMKEC
jgi:hypothetical protein